MKDIYFTADANSAIIGMHLFHVSLLKTSPLCNRELMNALEEELKFYSEYCPDRNIELPEYAQEFLESQ